MRATDMLRALKQVTLRIFKELTSVVVRWEVPSTLELPGDAVWVVERAGAPAGPFEMLYGELASATRAFRDDAIPMNMGPERRLYYRVRLLSATESMDIVYGHTAPWMVKNVVFGQTWGPMGKRDSDAPAAVREIRKRHYTVMTMRQAELMVVFREQWDREADQNQVSRAGSTYDFLSQPTGTDSAQGWYRPFLMYTTELKSRAQRGLTRAIMLHWPHPQSGDLLRSMIDGAIFRIDAVDAIEMYRHPTHYQCSVTQVSERHPVSQIPLPDAYKDLSPTPRRQFARATNLESYRESMVDGSMAYASLNAPSTYIVNDE